MAEREMTIGELQEKVSAISNGYYKAITLSELFRLLSEEMTVGALLDRLESFAGDYSNEAIASIERNRHMNELTDADLKISKKAKQRIADAVLVDFINFVARQYGGDRGEHVKHIREAFGKNRQKRNQEGGGR